MEKELDYTALLAELRIAQDKLDRRRQLLFELTSKTVSVFNGVYDGANYDTPEGKKAISYLLEDIETALE